MEDENLRLRSRLEALEVENRRLKDQLSFLRRHKTLACGIRGETLIASWVGGVRSSGNADYDVKTRNGVRIEVKFSALNAAVKARGSGPDAVTLRWSWAKVFGESGNKTYEHLILVGDSDLRHASQYRDPTSPFVIFAVPFAEVRALTISTSRDRLIQLTTNPASARSRASTLFERYQVSEGELDRLYPRLRVHTP